MLEVYVGINREHTIANLHAVRTKPKTKTVKEGTICKYNIVYLGITVDNMEGSYGCGIDLAIKLLKKWKENQKTYKMLAMIKLSEEPEWTKKQ